MATGISTGKWKGETIIPYAEAVGRIELAYEGKRSRETILATPPATFTVKEIFHGSAGENRLIHGENLAALAGLLRDPSVVGKIQLCYIDPPYATQSVFHSRNENAAYMDLLKGPQYIEFLRERLILIRELLADNSDEAIEVSIKRLLQGRQRMGDYVKKKVAKVQLEMGLEIRPPTKFHLVAATATP